MTRRAIPCLLALTCLAPGLALGQDEAKLDRLARENAELQRQVEAQERRLAALEAASQPADEAPASAPADEPSAIDQLTSVLGQRIQFYGLIRLDAVYDDSRSLNPRLGIWANSEPTGQSDKGQFTFVARETRLGLKIKGPTLEAIGGADLSGRIEIDFYPLVNKTESRALPRIRLAYLDLKWGDLTVRAGQDWDIISPRIPAVYVSNAIFWGGGNLGDRRPQVELRYDPGLLSARVSVGLNGAVSTQDLDGDGLIDGEVAECPLFQARLGVKLDSPWKGQAYELGGWATWAREGTDTPVGGRRRWDAFVLGLDFRLPIFSDRVWVTGEFWWGRNLNDLRGGILQGVANDGDAIEAIGGWGELGVRILDGWTVAAGYSIDDPQDNDVNTGGRVENGIVYGSTKVTIETFAVGCELAHFLTVYKNAPDGDNNRILVFAEYKF